MSLKAIKSERNIEAIVIALIEEAGEAMAMTGAQLRAKIRDLTTSGDLPNERPRVHQVGYGPPEIAPRSDVCLICGDPGPTITYVWSGRRAANLHAACDARWKLERDCG